MAFPTNPTIGQTHTIDNKTWVFNGKGWQVSRENEQYFMTPAERAKLQNIEAGAQVNTVNSVNGKTGIVALTKSDIGLPEVDNTSDINKPISNLQQQALDNKVNKNGTDRLLTQAEAELIEGMSPIEFEVTDVINGIIIPESPTKLYRISTATDLTVTINTGLLDLTKYIKLFVKINLNDYVVLTFPENWYFANLAIPTEVGEYLYEVSSSDGGYTWRASLRYKNIATVGIDQEGNEIVGAKLLFVDGEKADNSGNGLTWLTAKKDIQAAIDIANTGDAVFVKGKIGGLKYLPTSERTPGTARSKSFIMKAGINVYGGFKGIESTLYEREMVSYLQVMKLPTGTFNMYVDIPKYVSVLSGEIAGDSIIDPNISIGNRFTTASIANNSLLLLENSANVTVNGFDITGCNGEHTVLGGNYTNCVVKNNTLSVGSKALIQVNGLTSCIIKDNSIVGSIVAPNLIKTSNGLLSNCIIQTNLTTNSNLGHILISGVILNTYISFNSVTLIAFSNSSASIISGTCTNSQVANNTIIYPGGGGGIRTVAIANNIIGTNSTFNDNLTTNNGLQANSYVISNSTLICCRLYRHSLPSTWPALLYNSTLINVAVYNNSMLNGKKLFDTCTLINCTTVRNIVDVISNVSTLKNSAFYKNLSNLLAKSAISIDSIEETYSAFEDEVRAGTGNISLSVNNEGDATSPYFQSLSTDAGVVDEIYVSNPKIGNSSFLIDKGLDSLNDSGYGALYDLSGLERKVDTIDIGAYENQKTV